MSEYFHTLQDFMMQTKGMLYILSASYLIGFIGFWKFLHGRDKKENQKIRAKN